jgi:hypothetical protein
LATDDHDGSNAEDDDRTQRGHKAHGWEKGSPVTDALHAGAIIVLAVGDKAFQFALFLAKSLYDLDAGQAVLESGVDVAQPGANAAVDGADVRVKVAQRDS